MSDAAATTLAHLRLAEIRARDHADAAMLNLNVFAPWTWPVFWTASASACWARLEQEAHERAARPKPRQ